MLTIEIESQEFYDHEREVFFYSKPVVAKLEHSLISISKWESHFKKPYFPALGYKGINTPQEELYYIYCMLIGTYHESVPTLIANYYIEELREYIEDKHTATIIGRIGDTSPSSKRVTVELVYYWMIKHSIPFECDKWHLNKLMSLIDLCNAKEQEANGSNKMSAFDSAKYRHQLNKARLGQ